MKRENKKNTFLFFVVFLVGIFIRTLGLGFICNDMKNFLIPWYNEFEKLSFAEMLSTQVGDYNTTYQTMLWCLSRFNGNPMFQIKFLSVVFDVILSVAVFFFAREIKDKKSAIIVSCVTFLLPTVWINSAFWGQCDSIYVSFIVWGLYALYKKHYVRSNILFGVALSFKLQTVFIFPFVGYLLIKEFYEKFKEKELCFRKIIELLLPLLFIPLTFIELMIPNILAGRKIYDIILIYLNQTSLYPQMYLNYPSIWTIIPFNYPNGHFPAIIFTFMAIIVLIVWLLKHNEQIKSKHFIWCALLFPYLCVMLLPAMHERYGYLYEILAVILVICSGRGYIKLFLLQAISMETYLYYLNNNGCQYWLLTFINIGIFISFIIALKKDMNGEYLPTGLLKRKTYAKEAENDFSKDKKRPLIILCITILFFCLGICRLGSHRAPQTGMSFFDNNPSHEFCLNLGEYKNIKRIEIYTGEKETGNVSVYIAEDGKWKQIGETEKMTSVFSWVQIPIDKMTYSFDLIINDKCIREIVIVDADENLVLPQNASEYPLLFDEQYCYKNPPTYYNHMMFDEVYHGRTAYEMLYGLEIYETTHPPLGKTLISIGIRLFGMNPFGWRIISLLFGCLMIPIICMFAYKITKKNNLCYLAGVLATTEFMHFTLSRIATIDIIVAFFILGMFYGMYAFITEGKYRYLVLSGFMSGLGIATKWTAFYALAGLAILWLIWFIAEIKKKNFKFVIKISLLSIILFVIIPLTIYSLSYLPFVKIHPELGIFGWAVKNGKQILEYHSNVTAEHPYESDWYTWLINWRPLLDAYTNVADGRVSSVATFVNPLTSVLGLISIIHHFYLTFVKKDRTALCLLIMYLSMLVPWFFISRTVFIYQFFACTMIMILTICHSINIMRFEKENKVIIIIGAISTVLFIMFYPVISGMPIYYKYITDVLQFMPRWTL